MATGVLPSMYAPKSRLQPISENYVRFLLEAVLPQGITISDEQLFNGCTTVEDIMFRLTESEVIKSLFLRGSMDGIGRLGEFYVALRTMKEWSPRPGFDIWGAFEYLKDITTGRIEVKTLTPSSTRHQWDPRITGNTIEVQADVLVVIGMLDSYNPCEASLFIIPKHVLVPIAEEHKRKGTSDRPRISIIKHRHNPQTKKQNPWWEYEVINHVMTKEVITQYVHGDFNIIPQQMSMF